VDDTTLGGYQQVHGRPPAFGAADGQAYSVDTFADDLGEPGRYGAALLFVRWSPGGERPVGHVETETLGWGKTPEEARSRLESLSLYDVKAALDEAITHAPGTW